MTKNNKKMITVIYRNEQVTLDSNKIKFLQNMSSFNKNTKILNVNEETFNELKIVSENLFRLQTTLECNYFSDFYNIDSLYDLEYLDIYRRDSSELYPLLDFSFHDNPYFKNKINKNLEYIFSDFSSSIDLFSVFSDNMVVGGRYLIQFLFSIRSYYIDFYIHCDNINVF